jgi:hypothetical protein
MVATEELKRHMGWGSDIGIIHLQIDNYYQLITSDSSENVTNVAPLIITTSMIAV